MTLKLEKTNNCVSKFWNNKNKKLFLKEDIKDLKNNLFKN